ncbi:MAG: hypothetical protein ABJG88_11475 [Litorimonas sp.]
MTKNTKVSDLVLKLQRTQLSHDKEYHPDILCLDTTKRVIHMSLHNAKYAARFVAANEDSDENLHAKTLTDAFVISIATANALVFDLRKCLPDDLSTLDNISSLGTEIRKKQGSNQTFHRRYAEQVGQMAKACESLDHLETYPFREKLTEANNAIFQLILSDAANRDIDIEKEYKARLSQVEANSPFSIFL